MDSSNRTARFFCCTSAILWTPSQKLPAEKRNNHVYLDKYGRFPFDALPRSYKAAVAKFGKSKLEANGVLPWEIGVYSQKLTEDMKTSRWDEAKTRRRNSCELCR